LKNQAAAAPAAQHTGLKNVRILATSALLAAISVVLARLIIPMPNETTRFSLEAVPIFIAGMLFGPIPGALVGFVADFVGCLFSGYGYNPMFCIPPILYGLSAGLFRPMLVEKGQHRAHRAGIPAGHYARLRPVGELRARQGLRRRRI
ncbi:conserved hypothetical protein, membrane, partial [human gut metagenome]